MTKEELQKQIAEAQATQERCRERSEKLSSEIARMEGELKECAAEYKKALDSELAALRQLKDLEP